MKRSGRSLWLGACLSAPVLFAVAGASWAQDAGVTESDEVVVTAERRATTVREVGFSIAAVAGEDLRDLQINEASELTSIVPGFTINNSDKSITVVQIRGSVSTFRTATLDAPIGFFVDDVYYPYSTDLNFNFFDLNHAEILRGPQGTLFGRNVTGGAISIHTNDPTEDFDYLASATIGNGEYIRTEGMLNGALIDGVLAGRIAFSTESTDGLIDTPNLPGNWGESDGAAVRGKLLWTPTEAFRVVLGADYSDSSGDGAATALTPVTTTGGAPTIPAAFTTFGEFSLDEWTSSADQEAPNSVLQRGVNLHADLDIFGGTLTSITSYRGTETTSNLNNGPIAGYTPINFDNAVDNKWLTQEVRFASGEGFFTYVAGAFYLSGDYHTITYLGHNPLPGSVIGGLATYAINPFIVRRDQTGEVTSYAVFGEGVFHFTDDLSLTVGARWTRDEKELDYNATSPTNDPTSSVGGSGYVGPISATAEASWEAITPRVTLKWAPNDDINTYLTYSEGFKSGGWVDNSYSLAGATLALDPEYTTNIEAGVKTRLFDNRLGFNIAVFEQETEGLQNFSGAGGVPHTYNGNSRIRGVEIESTLQVTDAFSLGFNYAYLDATYTQLVDPATPLLDFAGNPLKYTPENSYNVSAAYDFALPNDATLTAQADYSYSDPVSTQDSFSNSLYPAIYDNTEGSTLNARLTYTTDDGRFGLSAWVKNATDNYQISYADDISPFITTTPGTAFWRVVTNTPRTFGVTLTVRR